MKFKIVVPSYNCEDYIVASLKSIANQREEEYEVFVVDDASEDGTTELIKKFCHKYDEFSFERRDENHGPLASTVFGIDKLDPDPDDVVITVDGDDWLAHEGVLKTVRETHEETDCLLTYGQYVKHPSGITPPHHQRPYPEHVRENRSYREEDVIYYTHLRTFRHKLWDNLDKDDLKNEKGEYYSAGGDIAYTFPLLEMAGDRVEYIDEVLYVYNVENPLNEHKVNRQTQLSTEQKIRNKSKYPDLSDKL